jgi:hypothetical protein
MKTWKLAAGALALCVLITSGAWAQPQDWSRQRDNDDHGAWQNGRHDGDHDRDDHSGARDRDRDRNNNVYRGGTWNRGDRDDAYRNRGYGGNGNYGAYGANRNYGSQIGYRDGVTDGRNDARLRRPYDPMTANFKRGTGGYNSSMGDKNAYVAAYRDSYAQGYQAGFGR